MTTANLYPLSTINGTPIPLDILRPTGVLRKSFLFSGATTAEALPSTAGVIMLRSTKDCFIKFANSSATKPTSATPSVVVTDTLYLQKNEVQVVAPSLLYYSVIGDTEDGVLTIQFIETWSAVALPMQVTRI